MKKHVVHVQTYAGTPRSVRQKKRGKKVIVAFSVGFLALCLVIAGIYTSLSLTFTKTYQPVARQTTVQPSNFADKKPHAVLFASVSGNSLENVAVLVFNPSQKTTTFVKLDRSTYLPEADKSISEVYASGGMAKLMDAMQNFLTIPLAYYARFDLAGLKTLVTTTGGVSLYNGSPFIAGGYRFDKGLVAIQNETQVLAYISKASSPKEAADTHVVREQNVLMALLERLTPKRLALHFFPILTMANEHVTHNLTLQDAENFGLNYQGSFKEKKEASLFTAPRYENGVVVQEANKTDLKNFRAMIQNALKP
ncbi:MAG: LCP family protein [Streptococcaceae bacterium]|nr:LCP family protein [Streptococcaceae bacterium]